MSVLSRAAHRGELCRSCRFLECSSQGTPFGDTLVEDLRDATPADVFDELTLLLRGCPAVGVFKLLEELNGDEVLLCLGAGSALPYRISGCDDVIGGSGYSVSAA